MTWTAEGDRYISTSDVKLNEELVIGDTYIVMVDGVHYAVEAKTVQGMPALGNTKVAGFGEDTGEPFCLVDMGGEYCYIVSSVQAKLFNVSKGTVTVKPIDPEYMPASVGTLRIVVTENDDDTFSSSHTYDEIMEALIAGKNVECLYGFDVLQLSNCAQLANAVTYAVSLDILFNTVNWTRQIIYIKITKTNRITKKVLDIPYEVTDDHINELIDAKLEQIGSAEGVSY